MMSLNALHVALRHPRLERLLTVYVGLVAIALAVIFTIWLPHREALAQARGAQVAMMRQDALRQRLQAHLPALEKLNGFLPDLLRRSEWRGSLPAFSSAVLDASHIAEISILEELNEVEEVADGDLRYRKVMTFRATYRQLMTFLDALDQTEMLIVVSHIRLEEGEPLGVTLGLMTLSGPVAP